MLKPEVADKLLPTTPSPLAEEQHRLGELLRHYRLYAGLSQEDLAWHTRIDRSNISKIENGSIPTPTNATLERLAHALAEALKEPDQWKDIYNHLYAAKKLKPETSNVDPEARLLSLKLAVHSRPFRALFWRLVNLILEVLVEVYKLGQRGK